VTGFDFLRDEIGAASPVTPEQARAVAAEHFGLDVEAHPLGSQQDPNLLLTHPDGSPAGVLWIANTVFTDDEVQAQDAAADLLAGTGLRAATVLHGTDGRRLAVTLDTPDGPRIARVLRHLGGGTLHGGGYLAPPVVAALGRVAGQVSIALAGFDRPGLDRALGWNRASPTSWWTGWRASSRIRSSARSCSGPPRTPGRGSTGSTCRARPCTSTSPTTTSSVCVPRAGRREPDGRHRPR
jgi:Ser/Thr protein kinase RdoA (MazF antagonist)